MRRRGEPAAQVPERSLVELHRRGRAAHPDLTVRMEAFGQYLWRCGADVATHALADLAIDDLYLACACAEGMPGAAAALQRQVDRTVQRAISRVLSSRDERQEAAQQTWQHLLVSEGDKPPRISHYLGHGRIESWISVVATRVAISFGRQETAERRLQKKAMAEATGVDPERLLIKGQIRKEFEAAVARGLARLTRRERLVMKLYLVSGMTLASVGASLGVTRQAVSNTLGRARDSILAEVHGSLRDRLKMSPKDLSSVARLLGSQLDISISRVLGNP